MATCAPSFLRVVMTSQDLVCAIVGRRPKPPPRDILDCLSFRLIASLKERAANTLITLFLVLAVHMTSLLTSGIAKLGSL